MNKQIGKLNSKIENLHVANWNGFIDGKEKSGWFRGDHVHRVKPGTFGLAQLIK